MPCARCPCKSLNNRIRCIHSRKSKATANHLRTLTNGYYLAEHTWLHNHNAAPAGATRCANPQKLLRKAQSSTRIHAPLRATLILSARPDRIPTGYRAGHHMNSCRALPRSAPVRRPPRRRPRPSPTLPSPVSRDAPRIFLPNLTKSLARALLPVNPSNRPNKLLL